MLNIQMTRMKFIIIANSFVSLTCRQTNYYWSILLNRKSNRRDDFVGFHYVENCLQFSNDFSMTKSGQSFFRRQNLLKDERFFSVWEKERFTWTINCRFVAHPNVFVAICFGSFSFIAQSMFILNEFDDFFHFVTNLKQRFVFLIFRQTQANR